MNKTEYEPVEVELDIPELLERMGSSEEERLEILIAFLESDNLKEIDGALTGLANMDNPAVISAVKKVYETTSMPPLKSTAKAVLEQLRDTKKELSNE